MLQIAHKAGIKEITIIILIAAGWNLIGYSSNQTNLSLSSAKFINSSGSEFTWAQALSNNKLQAYLAYYDASSATASERKYKYVSTVSGMDDTAFRNNKGYWIYVNDENGGNLSLPGVGGTLAGETYDWDKLRFVNASGDELGIADAGTAGWLIAALKYWNTDIGDFASIDSLGLGNNKITISSWEGIFVYSYFDNMTIIRQN